MLDFATVEANEALRGLAMDAYAEIKKVLDELKPLWTLHIPADEAETIFGAGQEASDVIDELAQSCNCELRFHQHFEGRPLDDGYTFTKRMDEPR